MKTAKLQKHGKGWQLVGEKTLPVPGDFGLTEDMNGQDVEFDNTGGPVKLIRFNGKDYTKQQNWQPEMGKQHSNYGNQRQGTHRNYSQQQERRGGQKDSESRKDPARAPYNFVPLNYEIVPDQEKVDFDVFDAERLSGIINVEIEALTDIFVRGQLEKFFTVNGVFAIPGSSLRGLIRSLTEIISYSRMEMVDKKRKLFFRNISDPFYKDIFLDNNNRTGDVHQKSKAGWLIKSGSMYFLQETSTFYKVSRNTLKSIGLDFEDEVYKTIPVWFDSKTVQPIHEKEIKNGEGRVTKRLQLYYNKIGINGISKNLRPEYTKATLLITGLFGRSKHFQWVIPEAPSSANEHHVTAIMQEYQLDENRDEKADLIKALKSANGKPVPCFFIPDENGKPIAIGHTGIFRHPYKYEIGHAVKQNSIVASDMAKVIFGFADGDGKREIIQGGKVFFEDAYATKITGTEFGALKILSSPKPTSFQLYLEQSGEPLSHWGSNEHKIRGHKLYWHSQRDWRNTEELITAHNQQELILKALEEKNTQYTVGEVLKSGSKFFGRIRFENLSKKELGAILVAVNLPEGCAHKLGMGKPLGLGSVKITPKLALIDRQSRYDILLDEEGNWLTGECKESNLQEFKDAFAKYVGEQTNQHLVTNEASYWANDVRMKELKWLLTFEPIKHKQKWQDATRYMEIEHPIYKNEYKNRPILPRPSEVVKSDT